MNLRTTISVFQTITLCSSSFFPVVFWFFPATAIEHAQFDAQWGVLGVTLVGIIVAWLHGAINERFPNMTGVDPVELVWGKWLGKAIVACYVPIYFLFLALSLYFATNLMKFYFPDTPQWVFKAFIIIIGWRGGWLGVETLGRVANIVHPLTFAGLVTTFVSLYFRADRPWLPHKVVSLTNVAQATYHLLPIYLGFNLFLMLSPYYKHQKGKSIWYPIVSAVLSGIVLCIVFLAVVVNLGWAPTVKFLYPIQAAIQQIRLQGFIVERLGIVIIILSIAFGILFLSNHIWALSTLMARLFNRPDDGYKPFTLAVVIPVLIICVSIHSPAQAREIEDKYLTLPSWAMLVGFPALNLGLSVIRRIRTDDRGQDPQKPQAQNLRSSRFTRRKKAPN